MLEVRHREYSGLCPGTSREDDRGSLGLRRFILCLGVYEYVEKCEEEKKCLFVQADANNDESWLPGWFPDQELKELTIMSFSGSFCTLWSIMSKVQT